MALTLALTLTVSLTLTLALTVALIRLVTKGFELGIDPQRDRQCIGAIVAAQRTRSGLSEHRAKSFRHWHILTMSTAEHRQCKGILAGIRPVLHGDHRLIDHTVNQRGQQALCIACQAGSDSGVLNPRILNRVVQHADIVALAVD